MCQTLPPALSILFYPPLFYVFEAAAYALFGVSHVVAQATVSLFSLLLGAAAYALLRPALPRWSALGASLLVIGGPEIAQWGRQVMLDIPAYAVLVTGVLCFARYMRAERPAWLYLAVIAVIISVWIKRRTSRTEATEQETIAKFAIRDLHGLAV